ncbi:zinc finger CCHC domain-containing protein 7 [Pristis pectinata]|uniref:zinc finger CCHC domain-containing protein 7 n=1 Tax=Pristis pectinata TaxID=685728 RepID=UPI00223E29F6|nr:zinc finger CCHC domain-containing protein 7 [Pristis pectinata]XP_051876023.1 zinc finger CCHC domain-containing protein 7 [Pristis pectinata]
MFCYDDLEAYEDELYHEESSSETEVDSEVEFQLYSQVHYGNNNTEMKMDGKRDTAAVHLDTTSVKDNEKQAARTKKLNVSSDSDVIVISGGSDVIILSDSEGDDSVYTHKAAKPSECYPKQRKDQSVGEPAPGSDTGTNHSTPGVNRLAEVQKLYQWMGRTCPQIQERTPMKESDDDEIENQMEDDDNIQLNIVDCDALRNKGGNLHSHWFICEKDLQKPSVDYRNRYYTPSFKNLDCRNCGKKGHLSKHCPSPKKFPPCSLCGVRGHLKRCCPERYCTNCNMPGHWFKDCIERACWKKKCHRCNMTGHYADACPEIWRQYHLTTSQGPIVSGSIQPASKKSVYCYNCAKRGHYGHECSSKWMNKHIFPASPLVYYYDTEKDIKNRERRIQRKVEELQDAGLLETSFPAKRWCKGSASEDLLSKKSKKKLKRELLKKRYVEQEQGEFTRNSSMTKRKTKLHHHFSPIPKRFNEGAEEDFPRGFAAKSGATKTAHPRNHQSLLLVHSNPPQSDGQLNQMSNKRNKIRRKKKHMTASIKQIKKGRKKAKKTKVSIIEGTTSPIPNNALLIKQKKKRKKHSKIKLQEAVD